MSAHPTPAICACIDLSYECAPDARVVSYAAVQELNALLAQVKQLTAERDALKQRLADEKAAELTK